MTLLQRSAVVVCLVFGSVWTVPSRADDGAIETIRAQMAEGDYAASASAAATLADQLEGLACAEVLDLFVEASWRSGKAREAATREGALRALKIKREQLGDADPSTATTLHHLGVVDFFRGAHEEARVAWEESLAIRREALGPDHADVGESMNALANLTNTLGDFDAARRYYEGALTIREKTLGPDHPRVAQTLNNLAVMLTWIGDYAAALPLAERSLRIKEQALGAEHPQVGSSLNSLADIYDRTGENQRALELFERAATVWEKALGPEHPNVAAALNNVAEQHRRAGRFDEAAPLYERIMTIWETAHGSEHDRVALAAANHALLLAAQGDLSSAEALDRRALDIREATYGAEHFEVAESLTQLSEVLTGMRRYEEAIPLAQRAVDVFRRSIGEDYPRVADSQLQLALLRALGGDRDAAYDLALDAESIGRDHLRLTGRALSEQHALRYAAQRQSGLDLALSLSAQASSTLDASTLLDAVVRSRAIVLDEMAARNRSINVQASPEVAELAAGLADARRRLANLVVRGPGDLEPEVYRDLVGQIREEKERIERALGGASAEFARQQRRARYGLEDVRGVMPRGTALVAYVVYERTRIAAAAPGEKAAPPGAPERSYGALILGVDGATHFVPLGDATSIEAAVASWKAEAARGTQNIRRTAEQAEAAYRTVGMGLRERLWDPLRPHLGGAERVFVVPDGSVNLVSFAALPAADGGYLVEHGPTLHYLSAERDVAAVRDAAAPLGQGLLVLGAPDYDIGTATTATASATRSGTCGDFDSLRFDPLPAAEREAGEIVKLWERSAAGRESMGDARLLQGPAATETAFKNDVGGHRLIHLATHGFFLGGDCASGSTGSRGLTVATPAEPKAPERPDVNVSPLLLSGLALAGANERQSRSVDEEDGVLTAEEIAGLDLSGVEWAVLSACDTGVGEIQAGEGVFGLRRAMQVSGVRTLIMSLWPVDDEATRAWMQGLYSARLIDGADTATAVRAAGNSVLEARRDAGESTHPFYWAAFVAAGDWR